MYLTTIFCLFSVLSFSPLYAQQSQKPKNPTPQNNSSSVIKNRSVTIDGKEVEYTVEASSITLKNSKSQARASIFHFSYLRKTETPAAERPVLFAFNGGPGSSSVWLHLGALGPKIVPSPKKGTELIKPNLSVQDNPLSLLDVADLVFIDPVTTGYSKVESAGKPQDFHSVEGDIQSVAEFIQLWVSKHKRWGSPKFLLGESYGGIRAAGLAQHLQSRYGMNLNGIVLLSSLLDFSTLYSSPGHDLSYLCFLPSFTATAHYHGILKGNRKELLEQCESFLGTYGNALRQGHKLKNKEKEAVAEKLAALTGISKELILKQQLRISPSYFRKELLRAQGKVLGRFDARVAWQSFTPASNFPSYDPSFAVVKGPFSTCMLDYLTRDLGWKSDHPYEIMTGKVHPWKWNANNSYVNMSNRVSSALQSNPQLKILVQCGHTDLATPAHGILHSLNHLPIPKDLRSNITVKWYESGHMFYLNQPDLEKNRKDLLEFINSNS